MTNETTRVTLQYGKVDPTELERLRAEYRRRDTDPTVGARYLADDPSVRLAARALEREIVALLRSADRWPLEGCRILDVGCGGGGLLTRLELLGGPTRLAAGVDLSFDRLVTARRRENALGLIQGDAARLPFPDRSFDLVCQSTVVSSILSDGGRRAVASEMMRVLAPDGALLWYDFIWNPLNRATRGVGWAELRTLFAGLELTARRVTLIPPLARPLARLSPALAHLAGRLPPLRGHYVAVGRRSLTSS